jgi:hypothetical protein
MKWITFVICIVAITPLSGQKIKYKDLFPLLDAKNYKEAEPQLRLFLAEEKNADEANAHYQFGLILEKYFHESDLLLDTAGMFAYADSASAYYQLAKGLIDDKEIRKNDEYYQSFYRRDLRTGEFGIKLSDVHLDIEQKIEAIQNKKDRIRSLHQMFESIIATEKNLIDAYNTLIDQYDGYYDFILKADDETNSLLSGLSDFQYNIIDRSKEIKELAAALGFNDKYSALELQSLGGEFKAVDPIMKPLDGTLETWDIDEWVLKAKRDISGDIAYLKRLVENTDQQLSEAKEEILVSRLPSFPAQTPKDLVELSKKYYPNNGAQRLVGLRITENLILAMSDTVLNSDWADSLNIIAHVNTCDSVLTQLQLMDSLLLGTIDLIEPTSEYFEDFFTNRYGSVSGVIDYVNTLVGWKQEQQTKWDTIAAYWELKNNWGIAGADTIPLNPVDTTYDGLFTTLGNWTVDGADIISYGVKTDSLIGFVARFGPDRSAKWQLRFDSDQFNEGGLPDFTIDTLSSSVEDIVFYLFEEGSGEAYDLTIVSFNKDEGSLNWSTAVLAGREPQYDKYSPTIKQHTIFLYPQEAYPLPDGELGYIVIDRNGEAN